MNINEALEQGGKLIYATKEDGYWIVDFYGVELCVRG